MAVSPSANGVKTRRHPRGCPRCQIPKLLSPGFWLSTRTLETKQNETIRELSARSDQLLDTAPDAMVVVGDDGRILLVNLRTEALFGYSRAELLGQNLELLIPERARSGHARHLAKFFAEPGSRPMGSGLELFARRKDGSELPIE